MAELVVCYRDLGWIVRFGFQDKGIGVAAPIVVSLRYYRCSVLYEQEIVNGHGCGQVGGWCMVCARV